MPSRPPFSPVIRRVCRLLLRAGRRLPAPLYGPRVADAQQGFLIRELCRRLPPRPGGDATKPEHEVLWFLSTRPNAVLRDNCQP